MMMEALHVIKNPQATNDEKDLAWEDFEMLIQQIDNACSMYRIQERTEKETRWRETMQETNVSVRSTAF